MRASVYPGRDPGEFFGVRRPVPVQAPAAGAQFTVQVPGSEFWRIIAFSYLLTTSAVVANRFPGVAIQDSDGNEVWADRIGLAQVASLADRLSASACGGSTSTGTDSGRNAVVLPDFLITPGWRLASTVAAMDVGDAITAIQLHVEAFDYGSDGWRSGPITLDETTPAG